MPPAGKRWWRLLLLVAVGLSGCATVPEPAEDPQAVWKAQQERLAQIRQWRALGRLAIKSSGDSWSARLRWNQVGDTYRIWLSSPLGQGLVELEGEPGHVRMRTAENETFTARRPEELMHRQVGWEVPLEGLRYWILGRNEPGAPVRSLELDQAGRLARLDQAGWRISYLRYGDFDGLQLPTRLELSNQRLSAKLIVSHWQHQS